MKIGLNFFPIKIREMVAAQLAASLGYQSLWYGEHVIVPWEYSRSKCRGGQVPFAAHLKMLDPFTLFATLASVARQIRFCSVLSILPLRDPFLTARTLLTLDLFSHGRLDLGVDQLVVTPWQPANASANALDMIRDFAEEMAIEPRWLVVDGRSRISNSEADHEPR
jgi:alkanesulfonate monooxygenase SsuD/methylene tetrahydromethanopterin reductase-like flavin-dependent oxidoreductase (luciferase family)